MLIIATHIYSSWIVYLFLNVVDPWFCKKILKIVIYVIVLLFGICRDIHVYMQNQASKPVEFENN